MRRIIVGDQPGSREHPVGAVGQHGGVIVGPPWPAVQRVGLDEVGPRVGAVAGIEARVHDLDLRLVPVREARRQAVRLDEEADGAAHRRVVLRKPNRYRRPDGALVGIADRRRRQQQQAPQRRPDPVRMTCVPHGYLLPGLDRGFPTATSPRLPSGRS